MRFGLKWILNRQRIILYWRMDGQQSRCNELIPREKILKGVSLHLKKIINVTFVHLRFL